MSVGEMIETGIDSEYLDSLSGLTCSATYSPEDNRLRIYASARLDQETYERVKAAGFRWAPKQECFVCPRWTPAAEDIALELAGEIGDEDYSPLERAADRAERFTGYRDKRTGEAEEAADRYDSGPQAFGHQSRARAERQARRHDRHRTYASTQWGKAEYWQERTRGVIANAQHRADPATRRGRIKVLEADQRKHEENRDQYDRTYYAWNTVLTLAGLDSPVRKTESGYGITPDNEPAGILAYKLANLPSAGWNYEHPRTGKESSLYSHLTDAADPITPREAAMIWLDRKPHPDAEDSYSARWSRHYAMRLEYERAMLANEGGTAADADMEPGGWIGKHQIQKVNKSPVTGKVVSVALIAPHPWKRNADGTPVIGPRPFNIERLPEGAYRAPTDEERAQFASDKAAKKAKDRETKPKAPPLINPTDEDAERLQAIWNERERIRHQNGNRYGEFKPSEVLRITQARYSEYSKGTYAHYGTADITEKLQEQKNYHNDRTGRVVVFKVRRTGSGGFSGADRVIVLTDKPQKPIPWDDVAEAAAKQPTTESMTPRLDEIAAALASHWCSTTDEQKALLEDAQYVDLVSIASESQRSWTESGHQAYRRHLDAGKAVAS